MQCYSKRRSVLNTFGRKEMVIIRDNRKNSLWRQEIGLLEWSRLIEEFLSQLKEV
jgi:hypothetical protein